MLLKSLAVAGFVAIALPGVAAAQSAGSTGATQFQNGYGGARYTTARPTTGSTRDANGNRLIVNSTQTNNGDVSAGVEMNGEIDLDD